MRTRLNKSLRWAVKNQMQVLTPQFYVEGVKLCDQDVDLGLDYALTTMLDMHAKGTLPIPKVKPEPPNFPDTQPLAEAAARAKAAAAVPEPELVGSAEADAPSDDTEVAAPAPSPQPDQVPGPAPKENGEAP